MARIKVDTCVFSKFEKVKPKIIVIFYVGKRFNYRKTQPCRKEKSKLHKYFGIFKDGRLRKLLGLRYEWKVFESGEIYVLMSMNDKAEEIIIHFKITQGKIQIIIRHREHQVPCYKRTPEK